MDRQTLFYVLGKLSLACTGALVLPLGVALYYGEASGTAFLTAMALGAVCGLGLQAAGKVPQTALTVREGIAITSLGWILVTLVGAVPYAVGKYLSVLDSIFECISGLSGTGATVITDIEALPQSILVWRAETHWLGGLGIIVIFLALFPQFARGVVQLFNAESTGPTTERSVPRITEMAASLFYVYALFTALATGILYLCGLPLLVALEHAFATIATGGFSPYNTSVAYLNSPLIEGWLIFFMILSSANFGMYVAAWKRGVSLILKDTEFRCYLLLVVGSTVLMTANLVYAAGWTSGYALRETLFQAVSLSSSTGFVSYDFEQWPSFCKFILLALMFVGGCAGSTAGGLKVIRFLLLWKMGRTLLQKIRYPRRVIHIRVNGAEVLPHVVQGVARFFVIYVTLDLLWTFLLVCDGLPVFDSLALCISAMGSCGPGFGLFGATSTCADLPVLSKCVISLAMLMGRLESLPVLALLVPAFWQKHVW